MIILRKYKEPDALWEEITLDEAIERLEGAGYWKKNTVKGMLLEGQTLWTPWALFQKARFYKEPSKTKIDDMIRGHHENYKEYLQLKRKKAIQLKSKEDLEFVETEYSFRRKISKLQSKYDFLQIEFDGDTDVYTTWVWGGFEDEDPNDPYHDEHYCDSYEEAYNRCLEYVELEKIKQEV